MFNDADRAYLKLRFDRIERMLRALMEQEELQMATIDDVKTEVGNQTTVIESVAALLDGLHDQLEAAGTDPAKLDEVKAQIKANTDALSAAVVRNTSAADETHVPGM